MRSRVVKALIYGVVLFVVAGAATSAIFPKLLSTQAEQSARETEEIIIETFKGPDILLNVELAITEEQQIQGLMNRASMPENHGMLFLFNDLSVRSFWMRNTLIPLDILFLDKDGTIHHIHPMAQPLDERLVSSGRPAAAVLEINGGLSQRLGIAVGDKVKYKAFEGGKALAE